MFGRMAPAACRGGIAVEKREQKPLRMYSVYRVRDEMPLIVYATAAECARAMGISKNSFYIELGRQRTGKHRAMKWNIYEDGLGVPENEC